VRCFKRRKKCKNIKKTQQIQNLGK
jgi:hypothetical protein